MPRAIARDRRPVMPRDPDLGPVMINPWHVVSIAPVDETQVSGCNAAMIMVEGTVYLMAETVEQIHNTLMRGYH